MLCFCLGSHFCDAFALSQNKEISDKLSINGGIITSSPLIDVQLRQLYITTLAGHVIAINCVSDHKLRVMEDHWCNVSVLCLITHNNFWCEHFVYRIIKKLCGGTSFPSQRSVQPLCCMTTPSLQAVLMGS